MNGGNPDINGTETNGEEVENGSTDDTVEEPVEEIKDLPEIEGNLRWIGAEMPLECD